MSTDLSRLIPRRSEGMFVNGGGAGVEPDFRRPSALLNGFAERPGGKNPGIHQSLLVSRVITAVDRKSGQVDHDLSAIHRPRPFADPHAVPNDFLDGISPALRSAGQ